MEGELAKRGLVCLDADSALWIMHGKNGKVLCCKLMID
jgi:hypothetical protein